MTTRLLVTLGLVLAAATTARADKQISLPPDPTFEAECCFKFTRIEPNSQAVESFCHCLCKGDFAIYEYGMATCGANGKGTFTQNGKVPGRVELVTSCPANIKSGYWFPLISHGSF